ncbi:hemolysin family protein [Marichromatium sp. AB32]|uniref:hemolysin family protein n=1 Tax=Marichromatium sp. AB32 TaxID=2483363 RepID=UPI000F3FFEC3|nr:hemolysin family protein [Marichromatium sp. AB32]RNE91749.1 HlyC/CorC family transporter [Marichromatium sp. AB32]
MELLLLTALILLNGVFAMSEIALVTARRARLARLAGDGDRAAQVAIEIGEDPTRFLSTIQIGITSIGILNGIVGEAALAGPLAVWLQTLGVEQASSEVGATVLVVMVITYVSIVIGELVPKRIGQLDPEGIARLVARPMNLLASASRPFVFMLSRSTALTLRLLGQRELVSPTVTEDEIQALLEEGSQAGIIEKVEHEMVRNVFRLDDRPISSLMTPRSELVWLDLERPLDENLARVAQAEHSRFPVCRGGFGDVLGVIGARQLFVQQLAGGAIDLTRDLQEPLYVPESLNAMELLGQFRDCGTHLAFVVDEYGEVQGMVTLHDLLESVAGEFHALGDEDDAWAVEREDGSWLLDGLIPVVELKDRLGLRTVPEEERGRYHTLSGMMMWLLGRLPATGDVAHWEDWRLEVVDLDGKRIDKVLASACPAASETSPDEAAPVNGETGGDDTKTD